MKVSELVPSPTTKVTFKLASFKLIPKTAGCYILATFEDYILYIGLSDNLYDRFQQHLNNPEKTNPTNEGKAIWFYYLTYSVDNLPKLERTWLNQFNSNIGRHPIFNKMNSPIS